MTRIQLTDEQLQAIAPLVRASDSTPSTGQLIGQIMRLEDGSFALDVAVVPRPILAKMRETYRREAAKMKGCVDRGNL